MQSTFLSWIMIRNYDPPPPMIGIPQALLQTVLLLVLTALVCVFYERGRHSDLSMSHFETWSVTTVPCAPEEEGFCLNSSHAEGGVEEKCPFDTRSEDYIFYTHQGPVSLCSLMGQAREYERRASSKTDGLFSAVGVPFLLLISQLISTAFYMGYIRHEYDMSFSSMPHHSNNLQKTIKKISLLVQFIFAGCFLFIQHTWKIPGNNLLLAELMLLLCLLYISFHPSSHYANHAKHDYIPKRILEFALTSPLMSVAAASVCGLTDITDTSWIFFTSSFMHLFILCIEFHNHKKVMESIEPDVAEEDAGFVLFLCALLCTIAYLMEQFALLIRATSMEQRPWAIAAGSLMLVYHVVYLVLITILRYWSIKSRYAIAWLDALGILQKYSVSLTIMGGGIAVLNPADE